jgi:enoyl-CoA hydratase
VHRASETTLLEGVRHERALSTSLFGTHYQREGMAAFPEKRKPALRVG